MASGSVAEVRLGFTGHETFPFRHGWLKKAVDAVRRDPKALGSERAIVELGVGKNMVGSIRHWGLATQVLVETSRSNLDVSDIGAQLFEKWDPYLEHAASVWLLHWLLVTNPARAATWYLAFTHYPQPDFTKEDLVQWILRYAARRGIQTRPSTIARDVDCLVRSYVASPASSRAVPEDTFDCPFSDLGLIGEPRDGETYRFTVGPKRTLPAQIFGYALLQFADRTAAGRRSFSIGDCMYAPASPGQVFKLDENSFIEYVEQLQEITAGRIQFDDTAGLRQVYLGESVEPDFLIASYYESEVTL